MGMDCPLGRHHFPQQSTSGQKALKLKPFCDFENLVLQRHGVAARRIKICNENDCERVKSQHNPANPPEFGGVGLTRMVVGLSSAAGARKAQVSVEKGRDKNFGMDSGQNSPRKE